MTAIDPKLTVARWLVTATRFCTARAAPRQLQRTPLGINGKQVGELERLAVGR
jgi:hypothetical protein